MADIDDHRERLRFITQPTRFSLIQDILAHPKKSVSFYEFSYANPSKSLATIVEHLEKMENENVVESAELPEGERSRDLPYVFWKLTDAARELLERYDLLPDVEELEADWQSLEKTEKVRAYQDAPRPKR